jgi:hypothetical protein
VQREHVRVALDEDHPPGLGRWAARAVDAEQHLPLVVQPPVRGVDVFGDALVLAHPPGAEAVHAAARVCGGKRDLLAEEVVGAGP